MGQTLGSKKPSSQARLDGTVVDAWYGLRFAAADTRFSAPRAATGRLSVSQLGEVPIFPQLPSKLASAMGHGRANPQSEDAFFLNVWAPANAQGLPVVAFIHGGAWMTGGGSMAWYDGLRLAAQGVVVVNVSYRVGPLGHLGYPDAHELPIPAVDLLLALYWVTDHIRDYGGDPAKITLMGQSAGGWYAHLLSVLPQTRGLINRLALLSMGTRAPWSPTQQVKVTERVQKSVNGALQTILTDILLKEGMAALDREPALLGYAPSAFLPVASDGLPNRLLDPEWAAAACHARAVYLRVTAHESATFFFDSPLQRDASQDQVDEALCRWELADLPASLQHAGTFNGASSGLSPYMQLVAASSWRQFQRFPTQYAETLREHQRDVRLVRFETESSLGGLLSGHCFDLPFQFGNLNDWADAPMLMGFDEDDFKAISDALIADIATFAREPSEKS